MREGSGRGRRGREGASEQEEDGGMEGKKEGARERGSEGVRMGAREAAGERILHLRRLFPALQSALSGPE